MKISLGGEEGHFVWLTRNKARDEYTMGVNFLLNLYKPCLDS